MCGGGGFKAPADNTLELERMRNETAAQAKADQDAKDAQASVDQRNTFTSGLSAAETSARSRANDTLTQRGLNPADYSDVIDKAFTAQHGMVPDLSATPQQYYGDDFINSIFNNEQSGRRAQYGRSVDSAFTPNFADGIISDTADDPFINDIIASQRGDAQASLDRAKARGNLNDAGYTSALKRLDEMQAAGNSTAQQLGGAVIQGDREKLQGVADNAHAAAGGYELGGNFDLGQYTAKRDTLANDLTSQLGGAVTSALAGQNFFDIGDLITKGGTVQGAQNPRLDLANVLAQRSQLRDSNRGLTDNGGVF